MRCFIQDLSLNIHSYLHLFLHVSTALRQAIGLKIYIAHLVYPLKVRMNLNGNQKSDLLK